MGGRQCQGNKGGYIPGMDVTETGTGLRPGGTSAPCSEADIFLDMLRLTALLLVPAAVFAQSSMQGIVTDHSGAAVPGASVVAVLESTGTTRMAVTGEDGRYRIVALAVGTYIIRCDKPGFQHAEIRDVTLSLHQTVGTADPAQGCERRDIHRRSRTAGGSEHHIAYGRYRHRG